MNKYIHCRAMISKDIDVPAEAFFDGCSDWLGFMKYIPDDFPTSFSHVSLAEGSVLGTYPLTRLVHTSSTKLEGVEVPAVFSETLLLADRETGTLVYKVGEAYGMRNYYGMIEVEPLGSDRCRFVQSARFDLPSGSDVDHVVSTVVRGWEMTKMKIVEVVRSTQ